MSRIREAIERLDYIIMFVPNELCDHLTITKQLLEEELSAMEKHNGKTYSDLLTIIDNVDRTIDILIEEIREYRRSQNNE